VRNYCYPLASQILHVQPFAFGTEAQVLALKPEGGKKQSHGED
jgi:hypothetical protein